MDEILLEIAQAARNEMVLFARKHNRIGDYRDLGCFCAISSYFLKILAKKFGYRLALVEGHAFPYTPLDHDDLDGVDINHCWNVYNGIKIIDITATQFAGQYKSVHLDDVGCNTHYAINIRFQTGKIGLPKIFKAWPSEQSPVKFVDELKARANRLAYEIALAA